MRITSSQLRSLIREAFRENQKYKDTFKKDKDQYSRLSGIETVLDLAKAVGGRKSPSGTKRVNLSGPKIQRWISYGNYRKPVTDGIWGKIDDKNGIVPFKSVDWTLGLLFSEGAKYVGSQAGIDVMAGTEYHTSDPTGRKASPYSSYVYYIKPGDFIQIDNVSVAQRAEIFNKFRNATPEEKQYYISVFMGEAEEVKKPEAPPPVTKATDTIPDTAPLAPAPAVIAPAPRAKKPADVDKFAAAKAKIKPLVRQPKDYAFWASMVGKASKGKEGSDATFVKQILGKEYMTEWTPEEMATLAKDLLAMSRV